MSKKNRFPPQGTGPAKELPEELKKFIEETNAKITAGKKRCEVCRQKTVFKRVALVSAGITLDRSPLGPVTPRLVFEEPAVLPFIEYCAKCGHAFLGRRFFEKQVERAYEFFLREKRRIELGVAPPEFVRDGSIPLEQEKQGAIPEAYEETKSGLIIPRGGRQ